VNHLCLCGGFFLTSYELHYVSISVACGPHDVEGGCITDMCQLAVFAKFMFDAALIFGNILWQL